MITQKALWHWPIEECPRASIPLTGLWAEAVTLKDARERLSRPRGPSDTYTPHPPASPPTASPPLRLTSPLPPAPLEAAAHTLLFNPPCQPRPASEPLPPSNCTMTSATRPLPLSMTSVLCPRKWPFRLFDSSYHSFLTHTTNNPNHRWPEIGQLTNHGVVVVKVTLQPHFNPHQRQPTTFSQSFLRPSL